MEEMYKMDRILWTPSLNFGSGKHKRTERSNSIKATKQQHKDPINEISLRMTDNQERWRLLLRLQARAFVTVELNIPVSAEDSLSHGVLK